MISIQKSVKKLALISLVLPLFGLAIASFTPATTASAIPLGQFALQGDPVGGSGDKEQAKKAAQGDRKAPKHVDDPALKAHFCNGDACPIVTKYINPAIRLLAALVGVVVVIAIIVGGIEFASAGGDPQKVASGKKHIMNALIGLAAFIFFYAFMQFIIPGGIG